MNEMEQQEYHCRESVVSQLARPMHPLVDIGEAAFKRGVEHFFQIGHEDELHRILGNDCKRFKVNL